MGYLNIKNFSCGYKSGFRISDIDLKLSRGAFAGIIGRNGSGKSTLFKGMMGDLPTMAGSIELNGVDLASISLRERACQVAIVSQFVDVSSITVEEYVLMGRIPHHSRFQFSYTKQDFELTLKYIELTGISHLRDKLMTQLSGGEQQMAAIACALTQQPSLLLLDEPTSHLDITYQCRIMNLLQQLNEEEGLTVVMIIHDLTLASEYCNHLTLMKHGRILCQGTPTEVITYQNIESAYDTVVIVKENPISNKPVVFPISERRLAEYRTTTGD